MRRSLLVACSSLLLLFAGASSAETFQSHDGTVLHYDVVGAGETVLLLSGGPGFSPDYLRPIADTLAGTYRFVLLHQRGTGRVKAPVLVIHGSARTSPTAEETPAAPRRSVICW